VYFKHTKNLVSRKQTKLESLNLLKVYPADYKARQPQGLPCLVPDARSIKAFPQSSMGLD